ncbi:MAG: hypothetical protein NTY09_13150 [bacterium]|nr:hypothetical protein [bacterium]
MTNCIWCKINNTSRDSEHIIPEALGCPENFVLKSGVVCKKCNNGLAHLDRAVIDDFDLICYMSSIPGKRNRPPEIKGRGNLIATSNPRLMSINMGTKTVVLDDGSKLAGYGKSDRNINAQFNVEGNLCTGNFATELGKDPKFIRGIYKIGLSTLAFYLGGQKALSNEFDQVRSFVRFGETSRSILLQQVDDTEYKNEAWPPYVKDNAYFVIFRLTKVNFYVDLSNDHALFPILKANLEQLYGTKGWTYLPIDT